MSNPANRYRTGSIGRNTLVDGSGSKPGTLGPTYGNSVVIGGRRITLASRGADRPGRTVGYRSLPEEASQDRGPDFNTGVMRKPLPTRGNDYPDVAPASRRLTGPGQTGKRYSSGGALPGFPTALDTGLPPTRIRRLTQAADRGAVANGTGTGVTGALGYNAGSNGGSMTIPHIRIPRTPITVTAFRRTVDLTSSIPARGIGAPVK